MLSQTIALWLSLIENAPEYTEQLGALFACAIRLPYDIIEPTVVTFALRLLESYVLLGEVAFMQVLFSYVLLYHYRILSMIFSYTHARTHAQTYSDHLSELLMHIIEHVQSSAVVKIVDVCQTMVQLFPVEAPQLLQNVVVRLLGDLFASEKVYKYSVCMHCMYCISNVHIIPHLLLLSLRQISLIYISCVSCPASCFTIRRSFGTYVPI